LQFELKSRRVAVLDKTWQARKKFDNNYEWSLSYILRQMASWAQPEVTITKLPLSLCDNATANSPTDAINKVSL
jgi:hypothetical protein